MVVSQDEVEQFFQQYALAFRDGLDGTLDIEALRSLCSTQFIAAGPHGVMAADNDDAFAAQVLRGYEQYRQIGTKAMTVVSIDVHQIDETHCVARVRWNSEYEKDGRHIEIPFTNSYLLEQCHGKLKVFGWITGDEIQLLKDNGLM
tara:strand:+ start:1980 stop:2417 length:438 start_codon:yes stop_codon:yes gene_type:complete